MATRTASYPVWIGSLSADTEEITLIPHFKKFGPIKDLVIMRDEKTGKSKQFGYVNYYNKEVAEMAAKDMNGVSVLGKKIKTKGPSELDSYYSPNSRLNEKRDNRALTDCVYFMEGKNCSQKHGQKCVFRHCQKAKETKDTCESWLEKRCDDVRCPKRHPRLRTISSTQDEPPSHPKAVRCPSHNAYKCYGQCGNISCNTHFQDEQAFVNHIISTHSKRQYSPCQTCGAVFFSYEEKSSHSHSKAESHSVSKKNFVVDNSEPPRPISNGAEPIGVFWDIENCRVPYGKSALAIVQRIRDVFYPGRREAEFICVCDTTKEKKEVLDDLNKAQVDVVHISATAKNAADDKLKQALRRFAQCHEPPATAVVVSGDINFASDLSDLRHRHNFRVVLLHNPHASDALLSCAQEARVFDEFISDLPVMMQTQQQAKADSNKTSELLVSKIPVGYEISQIKSRLCFLSANCGGKVVSLGRALNGEEMHAIMRFANPDTATRAQKRMENEDVFGSKIKVAYYYSKKKESAVAQDKEKSSSLISQMQGKVSLGASKGGNQPKQREKKQPAKSENVIPKKDQRGKEPKGKEDDIPKVDVKMKPQKKSALKQTEPKDKKTTNESSSKVPENVSKGQSVNDVRTQQKVPQKNKQEGHYVLERRASSPLEYLFMLQQQQQQQSVLNAILSGDIGSHIYSGFTSSANLSGVDLLVTNLDEKVSTKELKKKLLSLFREHCKVNSVIISGRGKDNLHAFVKVSKLQDAQFCISKVNNQKLFGKKVNVCLASDKENSLLTMKSEVSSILLQTASGWLPIDNFLRAFKDKFGRAFNVLKLDHMKDLVYIDGRNGRQFICLLYFPVGLLQLKARVDAFQKELVTLLLQHNRRVPFSSIPGLYWSYFDKLLPLDEKGKLLVEFVQHCPEIKLIGSSPEEQAIFLKRPRLAKGERIPSAYFAMDVIQLLSLSPGFRILMNKFIPLYHQFFGRPCIVGEYGHSDLIELLNTISDIVKVSVQGENKMVSFSPQFKIQLLTEELTSLLESREKRKVPLASLITSYYRYFGRKMFYRNYGFSTVGAMINGLPPQLKVVGTGDRRILMLTKPKPRSPVPVIEQFGAEVVALLESEPNKQIYFNNLSSEYYKFFGRQLVLADFGFQKLADLVDAISDKVLLRGSGDLKTLCLMSDRQCFKPVWTEVTTVMKTCEDYFVVLNEVPKAYEQHFKRKFPIKDEDLDSLLQSPPVNVRVLGSGAARVLLLSGKHRDLKDKTLFDAVAEILYQHKEFKLSLTILKDSLIKEHPKVCSEVRTNKALLRVLKRQSDKFQVVEEGSVCLIQLQKTIAVDLFCKDILSLLKDQPSRSVNLSQFTGLYHRKFGRQCRSADFGFGKLIQLFKSLHTDLITIQESGNDRVITFGRKTLFEHEAVSLLIDENQCVLVSQFAPLYQRKFARPCKASDYGFNKIGELLETFPDSIILLGKGPKRIALLKEVFATAEREVDAPECESPKPEPEADLESDDDTVIIESVEYDHPAVESQATLVDETGDIDLLQFGEEDDQDISLLSATDWWMEPLPDSLPDPILQPKPVEEGPTVAFDLISFSEFDDPGVKNGGLAKNYEATNVRDTYEPSLFSEAPDIFNNWGMTHVPTPNKNSGFNAAAVGTSSRCPPMFNIPSGNTHFRPIEPDVMGMSSHESSSVYGKNMAVGQGKNTTGINSVDEIFRLENEISQNLLLSQFHSIPKSEDSFSVSDSLKHLNITADGDHHHLMQLNDNAVEESKEFGGETRRSSRPRIAARFSRA